jgi:hypothetical protein
METACSSETQKKDTLHKAKVLRFNRNTKMVRLSANERMNILCALKSSFTLEIIVNKYILPTANGPMPDGSVT